MGCHLCGSPCDAPLLLGDMLQKRGVRCHHFCMLFSKELPQRGKDQEGLQGFKLADIRHQVKKCARKKCHYCRRTGAHATCRHDDCTKRFHIPCAVYAGALLSFFGSFDVHCSEHRPRQQVDPERLRDDPCGICLTPTGRPGGPDVLCTPCCSHNFHRLCLQEMALSSGYFFTCPICRDKNNRTGFLRHMKKFGVFVPQRDASWETEPNAFSELLEQHSGCDQRYCLSDQGRKHMIEGHSDWAQLLCHSCASFGSHRACAGHPRRLPWFCPDCETAFCSRRGSTAATAERRPTVRQLLMSEDRPATALTLPAILAPEDGELHWQKVMNMVDDPRQLLKFSWNRACSLPAIRTRAVQDPKNPGHVIMPVRLKCEERQLEPRVVLTQTDRWQAEQAAQNGGRARVAVPRKRKGAMRRSSRDKTPKLALIRSNKPKTPKSADISSNEPTTPKSANISLNKRRTPKSAVLSANKDKTPKSSALPSVASPWRRAPSRPRRLLAGTRAESVSSKLSRQAQRDALQRYVTALQQLR